MRKVFLPEPNTRYNLSEAKTFGEIHYLTEGISPFNTVTSLRNLECGFAKFNPDEDVLCLTGQSIGIGLALAMAAQLFGCFIVLMFDARHNTYMERKLDFKACNKVA